MFDKKKDLGTAVGPADPKEYLKYIWQDLHESLKSGDEDQGVEALSALCAYLEAKDALQDEQDQA